MREVKHHLCKQEMNKHSATQGERELNMGNLSQRKRSLDVGRDLMRELIKKALNAMTRMGCWHVSWGRGRV